MKRSVMKLTLTEKFFLFIVAAILIAGYILYYTNLPAFEKYVQEDGIVEWLTVLGLLSGCFVCFGRYFRLRKFKSGWYLFVTVALGLGLFFVAGEEVSWGQRILGIQSSEFFQEKNAQGETNLHNLVVNGVKLNKLIFSIGLIILMTLYLIVVPLLFRYSNKMAIFIDQSAVPVPRAYQVLSILVLFGITSLLPHEKRAELLEAGIGLLFYLIIQYPANPVAFKKLKLS
jgi:hypothetical protein